MVLELIRKEFKNEREVNYSSKGVTWLKTIFKLLFIACFIALEVYVFLSIDKKIVQYSSYGTYDFLVLFLFVMCLISIISSIIKARKTLFNQSDVRVLLPLPISENTIVFSKIGYIYIKEVILNLIISTPILITFGATRNYMPYFYIFSVLYPFIVCLFNIGVALILVVPYEFIYKLIKQSDLVQFILASCLVIGLCFAYQVVLNMFLIALSDSSIGGVFSDEFISNLHNSTKFLQPINACLDPLINDKNKVSNICLFLGLIMVVLAVGSILSTYFYTKLNKSNIDISIKKNKVKEIKVMPPFKALLTKELSILFKDSTYVFSYTSLLIMAPFLSFVVVSSLNTILYSNLKTFMSLFPELVNGINITLILLFSSVINASNSLSISREGKSIQIVKYIPIDVKKQLCAKLMIPTLLSSLSLLISLLTLIISKNISISCFFSSLVIGLILIIFTNFFGLYLDILDKGNSRNKISYLNSLITLLFPIILLFIHILLGFTSLKSYWYYVIEVSISLLLLIPLIVIVAKKSYEKAFYRMEI